MEEKTKGGCGCGGGDGQRREELVGGILHHLGQALSGIGKLIGQGETGAGSTVDDENGPWGHELPPGYKLCKGCNHRDNRCCERDTDANGRYFCPKEQKTCTSKGEICECHLFRFDKRDDDSKWEHRADPGEPDPEPPDNAHYFYKCLCVSTKK